MNPKNYFFLFVGLCDRFWMEYFDPWDTEIKRSPLVRLLYLAKHIPHSFKKRFFFSCGLGFHFSLVYLLLEKLLLLWGELLWRPYIYMDKHIAFVVAVQAR